MNSGRVMNLRVTIPAESRRMNVGKDVIRILGSPAYICVLQRKDRKRYRRRLPPIDIAQAYGNGEGVGAVWLCLQHGPA